MTATYDTAIASPPEGCSASDTGATCDATGGGRYEFTVDLGRIRNEPRAGLLTFSVAVPETHHDETPNYAEALVERFGDDEDDAGDASSEGSPQSTTGGLAPTAPTSPVARTLEATAETLESLAKDVTRAETQKRTSTTPKTRTVKPKPAGTVKASEKSAGHTQVQQERADRKAQAEQQRAQRKAQAEQQRAQRKAQAEQERADRKAAAEQQRADRKAGEAEVRGSSSAPAEGDGGLVDTVVKAVKKLL
jgi:hypothetical protein